MNCERKLAHHRVFPEVRNFYCTCKYIKLPKCNFTDYFIAQGNPAHLILDIPSCFSANDSGHFTFRAVVECSGCNSLSVEHDIREHKLISTSINGSNIKFKTVYRTSSFKRPSVTLFLVWSSLHRRQILIG